MPRTACSPCARVTARHSGTRRSVASAMVRLCTSSTDVSTWSLLAAVYCTRGRCRRRSCRLRRRRNGRSSFLVARCPVPGSAEQRGASSEFTSQPGPPISATARGSAKRTLASLRLPTTRRSALHMVGALIAIGILALGPGAERGDKNVKRGVMSEAVAHHVRSTDPRVQDWLRRGAAESQTFRSLLDTLAESDLIVHVQTVDRLMTAGQTYFVTATATVRYVRIEVSFRGNVNETVALIGHELQHAVEIA